MKHPYELAGITVEVEADAATTVPEGLLLRGRAVSIDLPSAPVRFYRHGWQSWSLTTWHDALRRIPRLRLAVHVPMRTDPRFARDGRPNGSWVGAVELPDDWILLFGALDLDTHIALDGGRLSGRSESGSANWFATVATESEAFGRYAARLGAALGCRGRRPQEPPRVWCSWYGLYTAIDERILLRALDQVSGMPFDVFQVDDGWQAGIGDWEANAKFPSGMEALASRIGEAGFAPGLWLAPLVAVPSSRLHREHPEWLLRDARGRAVPAGFNWGEPLRALDVTRPEVRAWLAALMRRVRAWGFRYVKLDFLYAGALPGERRGGVSGEAAYRDALGVVREALDDAYLLACGAPVVPSLGLCDGLRIGPDVEAWWDLPRDDRLLANHGAPGARNAVRTSVHRLWLDVLVQVDPDVVFFRTDRCTLSRQQRGMLRDLAFICGFKATSDLPGRLAPAERAALRDFLARAPKAERTGRYTFRVDGLPVDFSRAVPVPAPIPVVSDVVGWLAGRSAVLRLFDRLQRRSAERAAREARAALAGR